MMEQQPIPVRRQALEQRLTALRKLFYDFYELHDTKSINGERGKPGRADLQLQLTLYRRECVRIHNELIALNIEELRGRRRGVAVR